MHGKFGKLIDEPWVLWYYRAMSADEVSLLEKRILDWIREEVTPLLTAGKKRSNLKVILNISPDGGGAVSGVVEKHIKQ